MLDSGYSIHEEIFSAAECDVIVDSLFKDGDLRQKAGLRNLMSHKAVVAVANDRRLLELGKRLSGKELVPFKATLFNKTGKANWLVAWHQDTALPLVEPPKAPGWGPVSVKEGVTFVHAPTSALSQVIAFRIHLDASRTTNGPLRVIAGSHRHRILNDDELQEWIDHGDQVELLVGRGGVIAMSPLIIHASSKCVSDEPRRVLHIEYASALELAPRIRLAIA